MSLKTSFLGSILGFVAALALAGALVPAFASAQTYPYNYNYGNCNNYPYTTTYPYSNSYPYNNTYCPPQGMVFVYVQVNAPTGSFYSRSVSDFTVSVSGGNAYPATLQGSPNGQLVSVLGSYSITVASFQGYTPSYSSGCTGSVSQGQQTTCVITENPVYPYTYQYPYNQNLQYSYYNQPVPMVYVTPTYIPKLPNTGFEPQDGVALVVLTVLVAMALLSLPYVRKAFATLLG